MGFFYSKREEVAGRIRSFDLVIKITKARAANFSIIFLNALLTSGFNYVIL